MRIPKRGIFPNPRKTDPNGILCVGGDLSPNVLLEAYSQGIFPWPQEDCPLLWFCPLERGVLDFSDFHEPKSFRKWRRKTKIEIRKNTCFEKVIKKCATVPRSEKGTWIFPDMIEAYSELHSLGWAHSYEAFLEDKLVGGLYGVDINGLFSGESMFFEESGASKLCFYNLVEDLKNQGRTWIDTQMVTPVVQQFGGKLIPREEFLSRLEKSKES